VRRTYALVLNDRYLHQKNVSTYPPQGADKAGEVHEHWSFLSHDRGRGMLVFDRERFESFEDNWRARDAYELRSADELVESFELGEPGRGLQAYSRNHFRRVKR